MSNGFLDTAGIEKWKRYDTSQSLLICANKENKESKTKENYDFIKLIGIGKDFDDSSYWHKHPM